MPTIRIGMTDTSEQGVQQSHCRKVSHSSTAGQAFLLELGEIHDGHAPTPGGFTYSMLYLQPQWLDVQLRALFEEEPGHCLPSFAETLANEPDLINHIAQAFQALHSSDLRIVRRGVLIWCSCACKLLRQGLAPASVAVELGFADQSHLGCWFCRAYGLSSTAYRKRCSNLPDL